MSVINFIALVIVLAFAIGFFVAGLIWLISWILAPKTNQKTISGLLGNPEKSKKHHKESIPATKL